MADPSAPLPQPWSLPAMRPSPTNRGRGRGRDMGRGKVGKGYYIPIPNPIRIPPPAGGYRPYLPGVHNIGYNFGYFGGYGYGYQCVTRPLPQLQVGMNGFVQNRGNGNMVWDQTALFGLVRHGTGVFHPQPNNNSAVINKNNYGKEMKRGGGVGVTGAGGSGGRIGVGGGISTTDVGVRVGVVGFGGVGSSEVIRGGRSGSAVGVIGSGRRGVGVIGSGRAGTGGVGFASASASASEESQLLDEVSPEMFLPKEWTY